MTMQAEFTPQTKSLSPELPRFFRNNSMVIRLVVAHVMLAAVASLFLATPFYSRTVGALMIIFTVMIPILLFLVTMYRLYVMAVHIKPEKPIHHLLGEAKEFFGDTERMLTGLMGLMAMTLFMTAFSYFKLSIPEFNRFGWDVTFAEIDRALHFGVDPYKITMALFGSPFMTSVLNVFYHGWFFLMYFFTLIACFAKGDATSRNTYLIAFLLTWGIGGNYLATFFASAGPVYYEQLGNGATFAPLMDKLYAFNEISPVWALNVQETLWNGFMHGGKVKGISAFPSMHVAASVLMALYAYRFSRWAGHTMVVFTVIIMIGSVHLGWHYAIDGYASVILTLLLWKVAQWIVAWQEKNEPV